MLVVVCCRPICALILVLYVGDLYLMLVPRSVGVMLVKISMLLKIFCMFAFTNINLESDENNEKIYPFPIICMLVKTNI